MRRLLASRGLTSLLAVFGAAVVAVAGYAVVADPLKPVRHYCAQLPDSIGLYPGSHVRVRGVVVGTVDTVRPENGSVRVDFGIDAGYPLHGDVGAATVSDTLAADRDLTVLPGPSTAARWDPARCITRTLTPKSITETLRATDELAHKLSAGDDPRLVHDTLEALRTATAGAGPRFNQVITKLGSAARAPDNQITQVGDLIDALSSLAASVAANWDQVRDVLTRFPGVFDQINNDIFAHLTELVDGLRVLLPWVNDITREYGGAILGGLDAAVPYARIVASGAGTLRQIIDRIPAIAGLFTRAAGPDGQPALAWIPPKVQLSQQISDQVCAAVNALAPGRCDDSRTVDLAALIFGSVGAR
ncbi:MlaD family protein [Nocardia arthritidis]|uniref:MCE family protein n=1 Tax=Nocardia arthritidis TaxID=228602 RepID=A0A6G9YP96_9NOCA|nr:MlaD family protein [Nocardia arthritidis]QIS14907.1 MCE family protein [Nocardia arthritidis]